MSGVQVVKWLLANNAPVVAIIPATRIMAGEAPLGLAKPLILVTQVDSNPLNFIRVNETDKLYTDRVQVTAFFNDQFASVPGAGYPGLNALIKLIPKACPSQRGSVNGISVDSIIPLGEGPDLTIPDQSVVSRSTDFFVKWIGT